MTQHEKDDVPCGIVMVVFISTKARYLKDVTVKVLNFLVQERECTRVSFDAILKRNEECVAKEISWLVMAEALDMPGVARAAETALAKYAFNLSEHPKIHEVSRESLLRLLGMRKPS